MEIHPYDESADRAPPSNGGPTAQRQGGARRSPAQLEIRARIATTVGTARILHLREQGGPA